MKRVKWSESTVKVRLKLLFFVPANSFLLLFLQTKAIHLLSSIVLATHKPAVLINLTILSQLQIFVVLLRSQNKTIVKFLRSGEYISSLLLQTGDIQNLQTQLNKTHEVPVYGSSSTHRLRQVEFLGFGVNISLSSLALRADAIQN